MIECMMRATGWLRSDFFLSGQNSNRPEIMTTADTTLDRALEQHDHLKLIAPAGSRPLRVYDDLGAAWARWSVKLGGTWDGFERLALVRRCGLGAHGGGGLQAWPCPARCGCSPTQTWRIARRWLSNHWAHAPGAARADVKFEVRLIGTIEASFPINQMEPPRR